MHSLVHYRYLLCRVEGTYTLVTFTFNGRLLYVKLARQPYAKHVYNLKDTSDISGLFNIAQTGRD
jgi:Na+/serine symporter